MNSFMKTTLNSSNFNYKGSFSYDRKHSKSFGARIMIEPPKSKIIHPGRLSSKLLAPKSQNANLLDEEY